MYLITLVLRTTLYTIHAVYMLDTLTNLFIIVLQTLLTIFPDIHIHASRIINNSLIHFHMHGQYGLEVNIDTKIFYFDSNLFLIKPFYVNFAHISTIYLR